MVKIEVELAERNEPEEGAAYRITKVEQVRTTVRGYNGFRVAMQSIKKGDTKTYTTMLWTREVAAPNSKLGAFIKAFKEFFGDAEKALDTDNWINHTVKFVSWTPRNREVKVIE